MWAQYGGEHTGACLAFDIDTLGDDIAASVAGRGDLRHAGIGYGSDPRRDTAAFMISSSEIAEYGLVVAAQRHRERFHGSLYFVKDLDWSGECEFRWILLSDHDDEYEYLDLRRSLAGIVFGPDCPAEVIDHTRSALDDPNLVYGQIQYHNGLILIERDL